MKITFFTAILLSIAIFLFSAEALKITSEAQLINGESAEGMMGDYLLKNDSASFIISDIPHSYLYSNTGGQLIDAAHIDGTDNFLLFYLCLNSSWPRQGNYDNIQIISSGNSSDSAHIRVTGVDSYNGLISIITDYILYDSTVSLKIISKFTNNSTPNINDYGVGDAFAWGNTFRFPSENASADWLGRGNNNTGYGYFSSSRFTATHGSGWSNVTLENVTLVPSEPVDMERYFLVGKSLQDVYITYMDMKNIAPGTVSGNVTVNGHPEAEALIQFIKDYDEGTTFVVQTDEHGNFTAMIEPGIWTCQTTVYGETQQKEIQVNEYTVTNVNFFYGNISIPEQSGDTLTIIQSPLINIPLFALPGDSFNVEIILPQSEFVNSLSLMMNGNNIELNFAELDIVSQFGLRTLEAYLPDSMLYGLYDLTLTLNGTDSLDVSEQSVYIIPEYKSEYTFVHVSDTHLPSRYYWGDDEVISDSTELVDFREVINDINIINPEFVLHTGDLINDGEIEAMGVPSISRAKKLLYEIEVPLFLVAGNHDLGGWDLTPAPSGTARKNWWKFFGWKYLDDTTGTQPITQDYYFKYGNDLFIGLEAYELYGNYDDWRIDLYGETSFTDDQLTWLNQTLQDHSYTDLKVLFYHFDMNNEIDLSSLNMDAGLFGHHHNESGDLGTYPYYLTPGSTCDGNRRYRIIKVEDGSIVSTYIARAGSSGENLSITMNSDSTSVTITNQFDISLDNCLIKFKLEDGKKITSLSNASLYQIDSLCHPKIVYAYVDVPPNSTVNASLLTDSIEVGLGELSLFDPILMNIYPNPFNPTTAISYQLSADSEVELTIYDVTGRKIKTLINEYQSSGYHTVNWDASGFSSGIYFYRLKAGEFVETKKMLLMK